MVRGLRGEWQVGGVIAAGTVAETSYACIVGLPMQTAPRAGLLRTTAAEHRHDRSRVRRATVRWLSSSKPSGYPADLGSAVGIAYS